MVATTYNLGPVVCPFRPWQTKLGRVFELPYALDIETTPIDPTRPWQAPEYVLGACCDGEQGFFLPPDRVLSFWQAHRDVPVVFHNAVFDLKVLDRLALDQGAEIDVYDRVEEGLVWDTLLLHRLYVLATQGHTAGKKGQASLEHCTAAYLGCELPKDTQDDAGNDVRTSYGRFLGRDPHEIEPVYLEYLARDALATVLVFDELDQLVYEVLEASHNTWGFISREWLNEQIVRWGPQTHHIQLKAAVVLDAITAHGIGVDLAARDQFAEEVRERLAAREKALAEQGHVAGEGSAGVLQERIRRALAAHPTIKVPRTGTGKYMTSGEALSELAGVVPFFRELLDARADAKLLSTYLEKMDRERLHPKFDVLKNTGRTSSFGDINAQNLPRDDRVRRCFVPEPEHVFLDADYSTIEMATLAQSVLSQFGGQSCMAEAINQGKDLHRLVAARVTGKAEPEVSKEERAKAKPINFGKPGGMGLEGLRDYAWNSYGISLNEEEVAALERAWFDLFPEMRDFLGQEQNNGRELVERLGLTVGEYQRAVGQRPSAWSSKSAGEGPADWLGWMCIKVLRESGPRTQDGRPYAHETLDYFWTKAQCLASHLSPSFRAALEAREPGIGLAEAVQGHLGRASAFTLTGRLRANATYCARHNTVFQGLAADGAKIALWRLWRAGHKLVNFIHDQVLIEVPEAAPLQAIAEDVERTMVESMQEVVPDVAVKVEWAYRRRWSKQDEDEVKLAFVQEHAD